MADNSRIIASQDLTTAGFYDMADEWSDSRKIDKYGSFKIRDSYVEASGITGLQNGDKVLITWADQGTHLSTIGDVGSNAGQTPNSGYYVYNSGLQKLVRTAPLEPEVAKGFSDIATAKAQQVTESQNAITTIKTDIDTKYSTIVSANTNVNTKASQVAADKDIVSQLKDDTLVIRNEALGFSGGKIKATYTEAVALTGLADGDIVAVLASDTGTHASVTGDVGASGGQTPNSGYYRYSTSLTALVRLGDLEAVIATGQADRAEAAADSVADKTAMIIALAELTFLDADGHWRLRDKFGNVLIDADPDTGVSLLLALGAVTQGSFDPALLSGFLKAQQGGYATFLDSDGKVRIRDNQSPSNVLAEWDPDVGLTTKLAGDTVVDAVSSVGAFYGPEYLRETRRLISQLRAGTASSQLVVAWIGDSWTDTISYWISRFVANLGLGDAGPGFARVNSTNGGNVGSADGNATVTKTGSWVLRDYAASSPNNYSPPGPAICAIVSSTAGDRATLTCSGADSVLLYHEGGTGTVQYRYNGGSWTALSLTGSGTVTKTLAAPPAGAFTLDVDVTGSNEVVIYGFDARKTGNGVRHNKLAAGGSKLSNWTGADATNWQAGIAAIDARLHVIFSGTNDVYAYDAATYVTNLATLVSRIRTACPKSDILVITPPATPGAASGAPYSMVDVAPVVRTWCVANGVAHLNIQPFFGDGTDPVASYGSASVNYIDETVNLNHPTTLGTGAIEEAVRRVFFNSL